jgi:hypothetical protein
MTSTMHAQALRVLACHEGWLLYLVILALGASLVAAVWRRRLNARWGAIGVILVGVGLIVFLFSQCR